MATGHGAQCLLCRHQVTRGNLIVGCNAFEDEHLSARVHLALTAIIYRAARSAPCPVLERLEFGPDAYRASDLPVEG